MSRINIWRGYRVRLRGVEPEDWEVLHQWLNDTEVARTTYFAPLPQSAAYIKKVTQDEALLSPLHPEKHDFRLQIEALDTHKLVGTMVTYNCVPRTGTFTYVMGIFGEHRRKGYASEATLLLLRYFFQELRYQKATIVVYSFNDASMHFHDRLGFTLEGRLRRMMYARGQYWDELYYGMTAEEFAEKHGDRLPE